MITIAYFHGPKTLQGLPYEHKEEVEFSRDKMIEIIETVMKAGYNVMIQNLRENGIIIWIDKYRFQQR
jgi:hypothetical protein